MAFFLAVDAGGTKADFLLADETTELARVRTGTIKRMRADAATVQRNLDNALDSLTLLSGVSMDAITRTCIGTAGESVPLVTDWLNSAFKAKISGELLLLGDVEIALDAAFQGGPGVLVLAGTGSNVAGRYQDGRLTTAGGWGPAIADQGSGHRIGHEGVRAAFLAMDEGRPTLLRTAIMDFWQIGSLELLIEYANSIPAPDFSRLAEIVLACAEQGDPIALAVLRKEGVDLAYLAGLIAKRLQSASHDKDWVPSVAFAGSILEKVAPVREALVDALHQEFPTLIALPGVVDPIAGALWRARTHRQTP
ncbi:N-acetylglucosamine kinase [Granulicella arctica]|uniref:N-acetylglucosamine kinase n=1 Tax=Granulicella arctica TaxID=940613 RepID=UPI0021E05547|nr:BadF/BadG/BcrA/BcrD ATPase family protein [Granulicella arctica]